MNQTQHQDHLGRPLAVGDYVAYARGSYILIGRIDKISRQRLWVVWAKRPARYGWRNLCMPERVIRLEPNADLTMYYLKQQQENSNV